MLTNYQMFIDGEWQPAGSGAVFESVEPFSRQPWATIPEGDAADVDRAVRAARRAFEETWWRHRPRERAACLHRLADLLEARAEEFAAIESRDNGKTIREELGMNRATAGYYRQAASQAETLNGDVVNGADPNVVSLTLREPYGVVGVQTPWNTPGVILGQSAAPALAAGNALVVKPSEHAPCSTLEFAKLAESAGFPPGVINVVTGFGEVVGAALSTHPGVDKLVFTGSPAAGRIVAGHAATRLVPSLLELGGKSANIVFPDADLDKAALGLAGGFTAAAGQSCVCGSRALIHASVYDEVTERILKHVSTLKIGDPSLPDTDIGPVCNPAQLERIKSYVQIALDEGASLLAGGRQPEGLRDGWFFEPTVFGDVRNEMTIAQDEVFGPVLALIRFGDDDEAVQIANDSPFGLAAGLWTNDLTRAHALARRLRAGTVWVNHYRRGDAAFPFGGYGQSGYGRTNGRDGILEMTHTKSVQILLDT